MCRDIPIYFKLYIYFEMVRNGSNQIEIILFIRNKIIVFLIFSIIQNYKSQFVIIFL